MMVRLLHHLLRHERGRSHALETRNRPGPLERPVHHRCVELHHTVCVRQAAISHARVFRVQLDNVHPRDHGIQHVRALGDHFERPGHTAQAVRVLRFVPVCGSHDHGFGSRLGLNLRRLSEVEQRRACQRADSGRRHEFPPCNLLFHVCHCWKCYAPATASATSLIPLP